MTDQTRDEVEEQIREAKRIKEAIYNYADRFKVPKVPGAWVAHIADLNEEAKHHPPAPPEVPPAAIENKLRFVNDILIAIEKYQNRYEWPILNNMAIKLNDYKDELQLQIFDAIERKREIEEWEASRCT